jgi:ABC-2 type transport system ATP-binding protein
MRDTTLSGEQFELVAADQVSRLTELSRAADARELKLAQIELRRATLEDVFIKLTGRSIRDA